MSVTLHWLKQHQCQARNFFGGKTIFRWNNFTLQSLKHSYPLRVGDWRVRIFSYLFYMWADERETLELLKWLSKVIIAINWFSNGVEAGIITCILRLQSMLQRANLESLAQFKLNACVEKAFWGKQVCAHQYLSSRFKTGLALKLSTEKYVHFLKQIGSSIPKFRDMH